MKITGLTLFLITGLLAIGSHASSACEPPDNVAADPAFIQADRRNPEIVLLLREAKARGATVVEGKSVIVWFEPEADSGVPNLSTFQPAH